MSFRFVSRKVLGALATLAFVVCFNFFLFRVVEPDPVANLFRGRNLSLEQREELRREFGLDGSRLEQFGRYVEQTAQLNLGRSYVSNEPVMSEIWDRAWPTIALVGLSTLLSTVFGVVIGIAAAWKRRTKTDYGWTGFTMATYSMPDFWLGMLLLVSFAVLLDWFPVGGITDPGSDATGVAHVLDQAHHMFLPALTLTLARAKGLRDAVVKNRHAVPNALLPVVTLIAINFGFVLSGAIAVETIFSWPGLGLLTYDALRAPDLPMLQGLFLVFSAAVIVMNLVADLLYGYLDPRVRTA